MRTSSPPSPVSPVWSESSPNHRLHFHRLRRGSRQRSIRKDRLTRFFKHIIHTCQIDLTPVFLLPFNLNVCRLTGGHYIDFCRSRSATEGFSGKLTDFHISAVLVATFMSSCLNLNNTPFTVENAGKQTTVGTLGVNERSLIAGVLT